MAYFKIDNVRIAGIAAGVPKKVYNNLTCEKQISSEYDNADFVKATGVVERRLDLNLTASDLCFKAAKQLLDDLNWNAEDLDAIIFVSQTHDFFLPATACIMQNRLGCSKECMAEDLSLGCSGWVYGIGTVASLLQVGNIRKALLCVGDGRSHYVDIKYDDALFGYAGTVTALEYDKEASPMYFHFGTDGSAYDAIIVPDGGSRNPITQDSFIETIEDDGKAYNSFATKMKGMDVFSFGITTAPKSIKRLAEKYRFDYLTSDYLVLHQANLKMNDMIVRKLKFDKGKVLESLSEFGNTSSASIPMTIVARLKNDLTDNQRTLICCGFGVGLSWATCRLELSKTIISDIVEVDSDEHMI